MKLILFKLGSYYIIQVAIVILVLTQISAANELYINQVGNNLNLTVIQDGTDNKIIGINVTPITGNDNTISMTQQGNHMDVEGLVVGNNNTLTSYQGGDADTSFIRSSVVGNSNTMNLLQGKKLDGSVDNNDSGNHEQYITIIGDSNSVNTAQANSNGANSGHHMAHIITGNSNTLSHLQFANGKKRGFVEITGDNNGVTLEQRNVSTHFADIVLTGDANSVTSVQRGGMSGAHSLSLDLTNNGGAYTVNTSQDGSTSKTYSLTGSCATSGGCAVSVLQQ